MHRLTLCGALAATSALFALIPERAAAVVYGGLEGLRVASDPDPVTVASLGPSSSLLYDDPAAAIRAFGGYYFFRDYGSVEVGYTNLGDYRANVGANKFTVDMKSWDLTGVAHWPIATVLGQKIGVYASAGAWFWDSTKTVFIGSSITRTDNHDLDFAWGGGLEIELFNLALIRFNFLKLEIDAADAGVGDMTLGGITVGFDL
jgi:hypothetical protein